MSYELILLDADRTLWDFDKSEVDSITKALIDNGIKDNIKEMIDSYKEINKELWKLYEEGKFDKKKIPAERFNRLFYKYELNLDGAEFGKQYLNNLSQCGDVLEGALELCMYLKGKYTIAIVTNGIKEVQESRMLHSPLKNYFENVIISDVVGVPKPDPGIFEYALEQVGHFEKDKILMVGDSLSSDIKGGMNFGIDTCWFYPEGKEEGIKSEATYTIYSLDELYQLL